LPYGACRICLVEIKGRRGYAPSCSTFVEEGIEVVTESPALAALRRGVLELILAEHPNACLICTEKTSCDEFKSTIRKTGEVTGCVQCPVNGRCELQRVVDMVGVERVPTRPAAAKARSCAPTPSSTGTTACASCAAVACGSAGKCGGPRF
jgi:formate dehydrogenase major subunit